MALSSVTFDNALLATGITLMTYCSMHTATTSTTGAAETSGGSYVRQSVAWTTAASSSTGNSAALSFSIAASTTISYFGTWNASTSGTFEAGGALTSSVTFGSAGTLTVAIGALTVGLL
jgi:hypothetical protein